MFILKIYNHSYFSEEYGMYSEPTFGVNGRARDYELPTTRESIAGNVYDNMQTTTTFTDKVCFKVFDNT